MFGKKKSASEDDIFYIKALKNKEIPLLVLDNKWHELFPEFRKTSEIKSLENELTELIKKQGQSVHDIKECENAKKVIMENIVSNMTDGHEPDSFLKRRKQEKNQKLMSELNDKIKETEDLQKKLPRLIKEKNQELLVAGMRVCYEELSRNTDDIEELDQWIVEVREQLKNKILEKQEKEMRNTELYKYMHTLLGRDVVEIFDKRHRIWKGNVEENSRARESE